MYFDQIKPMNRKNNPNQWPLHPTHITVQDIDNTAGFRSSQLTLGSHNSRQLVQDNSKWTFPLTLQKLQPYLITIHATLIKNLTRKLLQRQLTGQQQQLIQCSRHDKNLQQFISGILAIQTCVHELTKEHTATIVSFTKATNLLLINYKFLYMEYIELKNTVKTSESLNNSEQTKSDGFMKFFDSLKFLALVIKKAFIETEEGVEQIKEQNTGSSLWDSWCYEMRKLQDLMSFESILNMDKSSILGSNHKIIDQKLVSLHNQQQQIIISQLQKENNFLRWQVFSKDNTITEYEESIYNVDLSRYRENEEREEYWARRVKFNSNGSCSNHNINNYSQLLNDGSGISHHQGKSQLNIIEEKILEPSELNDQDELTAHLNILSRKMEELEIENKTLREKLKSIEQNRMAHNEQDYESRMQNLEREPFAYTIQQSGKKKQRSPEKERKYSHKYSQSSNHTESDRFQIQRQKLDLLIKEIQEMKTNISQLEGKEASNREVVNEKNAQIRDLELNIEEKKTLVQQLHLNHQQATQKVQSLEQIIIDLQRLLSSKSSQLQDKQQQLSNISQQLYTKTQQLQAKTQQSQQIHEQLNLLQKTLQLKQKQILNLAADVHSMNEEFAKQMQKYNTVFYKISQQLSTALERADQLQTQNLKLTQKNKKLQQDNIKKQAIIVDFQTRFTCTNQFTNAFTTTNNPYLSNYNKKKSSKFHYKNASPPNLQPAQHIFSRQPKPIRKYSNTPLKEYQHISHIFPHQNTVNNQINNINQPQVLLQSIHNHNHYYHYADRQSLTPPQKPSNLGSCEERTEYRSKSPIQGRDLSKKKITIKVEGNKLVNQIVCKQQPAYQTLNHNDIQTINNRKCLIMRVNRLISDKENEISAPSNKQNDKNSPSTSPRKQQSSPEFKTEGK